MAIKKTNKNTYDSLERIQVAEDWFHVYRIPNDVIAIYEPSHFQGVISYLINGSKTALLWDTGMGIGNMKEVVMELTDKPVIVLNSHIHFDHIGSNYLFDEVLVFDNNDAINRLKRGYSTAELIPHTKEKLFYKEAPAGFERSNYFIPPSNPRPVQDGDTIDLGDRILEIIHAPGHSYESIMLLDKKNKMLFTGDGYYPGHLYAHFDGTVYGKSDIETYAKTMKRISQLVPELHSIHPSHNYPISDPTILIKVAEALELLAEGKVSSEKLMRGDLSLASLPDTGEVVEGYVVPDDLYIYDFDGFSVITRDRHSKSK
ncbi:MBL fold metallo-hydrolase [Brevibacillus sp. NRS-1366]|uniref:MBL fold metallo-hydrolase n=1 Tax=Brevibacillus sp. NRS-1366 TaxID=3233899 RepID=UPI003D1F93BB